MEEPYWGDEAVVVDCETSHFDRNTGELLSLATVKVVNHTVQLSSALEVTLNTDTHTDPQAVRIHGLRREDRFHGISSDEAIDKFLNFVGNRPICGFFINYDRSILNRYVHARYGFHLPNEFIEVSQLYIRYLRKKNPNLQDNLTFEHLAEELNIPIFDRHTALGDATSTALMYIKLSKKLS